MKLKMIDVNSVLESKKYQIRKKIEETFGKNNRKGRSQSNGNEEERKQDENLIKKYREDEETKTDKIPDPMKDLSLDNLSIFSKKKF